MIDNSDYCVFYYDKDYKPKTRENLKGFNANTLKSARSGTAIAFNYAVKKNKTIINLFK